jgi:uncharacterized membrane protein
MTETTHSQPLTAGRRPGAARPAGLVLGAATVAMGLIAGFFFDWAVAIMPALAMADDRTFVTVMLDLITTINNSPLFVLAFMSALLFTAAAAILLHSTGARPAARWTFAALALYLVACIITFAVHFPLHDALAAADPTNPAAAREDIEGPWTSAHLIRTLAATAALATLCRALLLHRRSAG